MRAFLAGPPPPPPIHPKRGPVQNVCVVGTDSDRGKKGKVESVCVNECDCVSAREGER